VTMVSPSAFARKRKNGVASNRERLSGFTTRLETTRSPTESGRWLRALALLNPLIETRITAVKFPTTWTEVAVYCVRTS
jgi:hypothetical protein